MKYGIKGTLKAFHKFNSTKEIPNILNKLKEGFIISIISCYSGLYSGKGAFGVGSATTNSVVVSSILILFSNYILTEIFF